MMGIAEAPAPVVVAEPRPSLETAWNTATRDAKVALLNQVPIEDLLAAIPPDDLTPSLRPEHRKGVVLHTRPGTIVEWSGLNSFARGSTAISLVG